MTVSHRFVVIVAVFVTCLITANIIAVKVISPGGGLIYPAAVVVFPTPPLPTQRSVNSVTLPGSSVSMQPLHVR